MKIVLLLAGLCALALATPTPVTTKWIPKKYHIDDKVFLEKQYNIYRLFKYVHQPTHYKEFVDIAASYVPWDHVDHYTQPQWINEFTHYYKHDILPRGEIFSVFYPEHLKPAIALFKTFFYAKDYETFFKTAVWARQHVNEGIWLYAFSVALVHRPDTFGIVLPPIYELYPHYFFNTEVLHQAHEHKETFNGKYPHVEPKWEGWTIEANYSGWYMNLHPEQSLSYFTEDIGLNSFYYYYHIYYPFWMDGEEFGLKKDKRGELFYYVHQQLLSRYYLERLSNDFGEIPTMHWDWPIETGYYPSLQYHNGMEFPSRPNHVSISRHWEFNHPHFSNFSNSYTYVMDFARRMRDAIDLGFVIAHDKTKVSLYTDEGLEILANMIEGNPDSPNIDFYGVIQMYARHLLGYSHTPLHKYKTVPSVLEHFETSLRDPVFWQFYKWITGFFYEYKHHLPHYTKHELEFTGVKVEELHVDRLITYFDSFYSHLGHAVNYHEGEWQGEPFHVRAKQQRLNHKPFTYTMTVSSAKAVDAIAKVFIGPKFDEYGRPIDINENRMNFFLIDKFVQHLQPGKNVITRNSRNTFFVSDRTSFVDVYKHIMGAYKGTEEFTIDGSEAFWGFPNRLMLPKGTLGGQTYQFYVIFYPYTQAEKAPKLTDDHYYPMVGSGIWGKWFDDLPYGYPFDRTIDQGSFFVDNAYFKDVVIYHKKFEDLNIAPRE